MSSSGKGQSVVRSEADIAKPGQYAQEGGRAGKGKVIVEGFVEFDYEITLLTVRHAGGTSFCAADRPPPDRRRLSRVLAAAADDARRSLNRSASPRPITDGARRPRPLRRRAVREGRQRLVQRGLAAAARHGPRDVDLAGPRRVRAARAGHPWPADSEHPSARAQPPPP